MEKETSGKKTVLTVLKVAVISLLLLAMLDVFPFRISYKINRTLPAVMYQPGEDASETASAIALRGTITLRLFGLDYFEGSMHVQGISRDEQETPVLLYFRRAPFGELRRAPVPGIMGALGRPDPLQGELFASVSMRTLLLIHIPEDGPLRVVAAPAHTQEEAEALVARYLEMF